MALSVKTTIGGAFSALGTTMMGVGVVPQLAGSPSKMLTGIAIAGFVCNGIGAFLAHLFAADAKDLQTVADYAQQTRAAVMTGDKAGLAQAQALLPAVAPVAPTPPPPPVMPTSPAPAPLAK